MPTFLTWNIVIFCNDQLKKYEPNKDKVLNQLMSVLNIEETDYLILTPQLIRIARRKLGKALFDVGYARTEIISAIKFFLAGI